MEKFIVSARKYRPTSFETLLGQENIARTLKNSIQREQLAHAYLFCGPRGVGKTTAARIFAKTINCSNPGPDMDPCGVCESCRSFAENRSYCIHELDAASNNSVDEIRSLTDQVRIPPQVGRYSVFIIDEVHMLSQAAFNAFLKTLEEPPAHAIFILATTEKHKILPTILSRCQTFDFNRISVADIVRNISGIAAAEGVTISDDAMHIIAQKADGAMRDALTLFDQTVAFCGREITYAQVIRNLNVLDYEYYFRLTDAFLAGDWPAALLTFDEILSKGFNAQAFTGGLSSHIRDLIVCKNGSTQTLLELAPSVADRYRTSADRCSIGFLFKALEICTNCEAQYRSAGNPRLLIEFALMKVCSLAGLVSASSEKAGDAEAQQSRTQPQVQTRQQPQPEPQPKPQPEPQPHIPAGLSISDILKDTDVTGPASAAKDRPADEAEGAEPLSEDRLKVLWQELVSSQASRPSLSTALAAGRPSIADDSCTITFTVNNVAQKNWIEHKVLSEMEKFLRSKASDNRLVLRVEVEEVPETNRNLLYMPADKAAHLQQTSEEFRQLKRDFNLETE